MSASKFSSSPIDVENETEDVLLIAADNTNASSLPAELTCDKIRFLLKNKKNALTIVNCSKKHIATC